MYVYRTEANDTRPASCGSREAIIIALKSLRPDFDPTDKTDDYLAGYLVGAAKDAATNAKASPRPDAASARVDSRRAAGPTAYERAVTEARDRLHNGWKQPLDATGGTPAPATVNDGRHDPRTPYERAVEESRMRRENAWKEPIGETLETINTKGGR